MDFVSKTWGRSSNGETIGASWVKIAQEKKMNEATARSIFKEKDKIRAQGKLPNLNSGSAKLGASPQVQGKWNDFRQRFLS